MSKTSTPDDSLTYEQARAELAEVVAALESGGAPLAESVALWRRGEALADICQKWLDGARAALDAAAPISGTETSNPADGVTAVRAASGSLKNEWPE